MFFFAILFKPLLEMTTFNLLSVYIINTVHLIRGSPWRGDQEKTRVTNFVQIGAFCYFGDDHKRMIRLKNICVFEFRECSNNG